MSSQGEINIAPRIVGEFKYPRNGDSAYQIAVNNGFVGTEEQWLASLKGEKGADGLQGQPGEPGYSPVKGTDYWNEADKAEIETYCNNYIDTQITEVIGGSY